MIGAPPVAPGRPTPIVRASAVGRALAPVGQLANRVVAAFGGLTRRDDDAAREDRTAEAVFHDSRIGLSLTAATDACARAWACSVAGSHARRAWSEWRSADLMDRIRATCWLALVAAATAVVLRRASSRIEPLTWIVPAAVAVVAVVVMVATPGARRDTTA